MKNANSFEQHAGESKPTKAPEHNHSDYNSLPGLIFIAEITNHDFNMGLKMIYANDRAILVFEHTLEEMEELGHCFFENILPANDTETILRSVDKFISKTENIELSIFPKLKLNEKDSIWIKGNFNVCKWDENGAPLQLQFNCVLMDDDMHTETKADEWCKERRMARHKESIKLATPAELAVWRYFLKGYSLKKIAETIDISAKTIRNQRQALYNKFNLHKINELMALGYRYGLNE